MTRDHKLHFCIYLLQTVITVIVTKQSNTHCTGIHSNVFQPLEGLTSVTLNTSLNRLNQSKCGAMPWPVQSHLCIFDVSLVNLFSCSLNTSMWFHGIEPLIRDECWPNPLPDYSSCHTLLHSLLLCHSNRQGSLPWKTVWYQRGKNDSWQMRLCIAEGVRL